MAAAVAAGAERAALRIGMAGMIDRADRDVAAAGKTGDEHREDQHSHRGNMGAPSSPQQGRVTAGLSMTLFGRVQQRDVGRRPGDREKLRELAPSLSASTMMSKFAVCRAACRPPGR
jgi:hypothetical protein